MFKSIKLTSRENNDHYYRLIDDSFEADLFMSNESAGIIASLAPAESHGLSQAACARAVIMAIEYDERGLSAGKNLLLFARYSSKEYGDAITKLISYQDKFIPSFLKKINYPNYESKWEQWKKERDHFLVMV